MTNSELERLAYRAKDLVLGMWNRDRSIPDKADFLAAFEHELFGKDEKLGRRSEHHREFTPRIVDVRFNP